MAQNEPDLQTASLAKGRMVLHVVVHSAAGCGNKKSETSAKHRRDGAPFCKRLDFPSRLKIGAPQKRGFAEVSVNVPNS
jgi:hypothetical protein